jgi:hypothetical protein
MAHRHALRLDLGLAPARSASRARGWLTAIWQRIPRRRAVPADLQAQLAVKGRERVLSVGRAPDGGCALVATDQALYHRGGNDGWSRLGWEQVTRVGWDTAHGQLDIAGLAGMAPRRTVVPLRDRGALPELAEERITHTRLGRWHMQLPGHNRLLVEVRRRPVTGELVWTVISTGNMLDADVSEIRGQIDRAVAQIGELLGVTHQSSALIEERLLPPSGGRLPAAVMAFARSVPAPARRLGRPTRGNLFAGEETGAVPLLAMRASLPADALVYGVLEAAGPAWSDFPAHRSPATH